MSPADAAARAPGTLLAAERERQGLSRADVAQRLRMSASQIEALETGDYERLPRGTFLRGFVRNYAKVVGMDPDPLVGSLTDSAPRDARPGLVVASQNIRFDPLSQGLHNPYVKAAGLATVIVAVAFAAMYWWLFIRPAPPATMAAKKVAAAEAPAARAPRVEAPQAPIAELARPELAKAEPVKAEPPKAESARAEAAKAARPEPAAPLVPALASQSIDAGPVIAAGGSVIRLKFRGSAWVEIKDGRGKVLLSRNHPGGSEAEVVGKGPFSVIVGNAPEVTMYYNDREFDLEPHTRVAVARFIVQ